MNKQREVIYDERNAHPGRQGHPRPRRGDDRRDDHRRRARVLPREDLLRGVGLGRAVALWYRELTGIDGCGRGAARRGRQPARARRRAHGSRARGATRARRRSSARTSSASSSASVMLRVIDTRWMDHLSGDGLPQGGHRPARDGSARPDRRVQDRGVRHVRRPRGQHQRGLPAHDHAHPGRVRAEPQMAPSLIGGELLGAERVLDLRAARRPRPTRSASAVRRPTRSPRRRPRRVAAARRRRWSRTRTTRGPTSGATTRARAAAARSTRSATARARRDGRRSDGREPHPRRSPRCANASRQHARVPAHRRQASRARRARGEGRRARLLGRPVDRAGGDGAAVGLRDEIARLRGRSSRALEDARGRQRARRSPRTTRSMAAEVTAGLLEARASAIDELEVASWFTGEFDHGDAIVTITPGQGGLEAQDWAEMLLQDVHEVRRAQEVEGRPQRRARPASRSASTARSFTVHGRNAYGMLSVRGRRAPARAHQPHRREEAPPDHVRRRRGAAGAARRHRGRHPRRGPAHRRLPLAAARAASRVNTTDSAVRITHIPTGTRRDLPEREVAAQEQGRGDEDPALAPLRDREGQARRRARRAARPKRDISLRQSDPQLRALPVPAGQGRAHAASRPATSTRCSTATSTSSSSATTAGACRARARLDDAATAAPIADEE